MLFSTFTELTTNQRTILSAIVYQPSEQSLHMCQTTFLLVLLFLDKLLTAFLWAENTLDLGKRP